VDTFTAPAALQDDVQLRVMRRLEAEPDVNQRLLARELELSLGSVNYCLKALVAKGWVKIQNFSHSRNKLGYVYTLTPKGLSEKAALTSRFLKRKLDEYEKLKAEITMLRSEVEGRDEGHAE
jgi:EPS-associated MarR family transcriptional regulator